MTGAYSPVCKLRPLYFTDWFTNASKNECSAAVGLKCDQPYSYAKLYRQSLIPQLSIPQPVDRLKTVGLHIALLSSLHWSTRAYRSSFSSLMLVTEADPRFFRGVG
ncbi:hypothetical protein LguiA_000053 [Lonicera macranthoides]